MSSNLYRSAPQVSLGYQEFEPVYQHNTIGSLYVGATMTCREGKGCSTSSPNCYSSAKDGKGKATKCNQIYGSLQPPRCLGDTSYVPWVYDAGAYEGIVSHFKGFAPY